MMHRSASRPSARRLLPFALVGAVAAMACNESDYVATPNRNSASPVVIISPKAAVLNAGGTRQFTAEVRAPNGSVMNVPVRFESGDTTIVRVTASGNATAVGDGVASVIAYIDEGARTSASVAVIPTNVSSVQLMGNDSPLAVTNVRQLLAQAFDASGRPIPGAVTWSSSAPSIVTVNEAGVIEAVGEGTATITGTIGGQSASFNIQAGFFVSSITLTPNPLMVASGASGTITALPVDGTGNPVANRTAVWSLANPVPHNRSGTGDVATFGGSISSSGPLTGSFSMNPGSFGSNIVTGTITDPGGTNTATALVNPLVHNQTVTGITGIGDQWGSAAGTDTYAYLFNVPAGTTAINVTFFAQPGQDADLYVFNPAGTTRCNGEAGTGSNEVCNITTDITPGIWRVHVSGYTNFTNWSLRMQLTPAP